MSVGHWREPISNYKQRNLYDIARSQKRRWKVGGAENQLRMRVQKAERDSQQGAYRNRLGEEGEEGEG